VDNSLNALEIRVLGTLIEKESTTPEYYPMSLNGLLAACNQKTSRFPVSDYSEGDILEGIAALRSRGYAAEISGSGRVTKFAQRFTEKINLGRRETAVLCVLMLRGAQTAGEIKGRTERMYSFGDLEEVETVLRKLLERPEGPLAQKLLPMPGMKEPRYAQTLGGAVETAAYADSVPQKGGDRLSAVEAEVARLREELDELRRRFDALAL
jgi:uncharacterized protein YceH (UPF0502 family)